MCRQLELTMTNRLYTRLVVSRVSPICGRVLGFYTRAPGPQLGTTLFLLHKL